MNANGSLRALYGPVFGDSIGGLIAWRMAGFGAVLAAVMSLLIVVRHTREEEETGRQELLSAAMVGRRAPLTAALLTALTANAALALVIAGGLRKSGRPAAGSLALGLAIGAPACSSPAWPPSPPSSPRARGSAKGLTGAVLGLAFALRAAGDAADLRRDLPADLDLARSAGRENLRPYAGERWWIILLFLAATALTVSAAYALTARRDLGHELPARPPRTGPSRPAR